jgi:hypothetical protein
MANASIGYGSLPELLLPDRRTQVKTNTVAARAVAMFCLFISAQRDPPSSA